MIASRPALTFLLSVVALLRPPAPVDGHGYIKSPRSCNFVAYEDGMWWPLLPSNPDKESDPQAANRGGTLARCGIIGSTNYDSQKNAVGGPMPPNPQACWRPGNVVDLEAEMTAHHMGE